MHESNQSPNSVSPISLIMAHAEQEGFEDFFEAMLRQQNLHSACSLKTFSPLIQIITSEQESMGDEFEVAKLARKLVHVVRSQALSVCDALDIDVDSMNWARSFFAMNIAQEMAKAWPTMGQKALEVEWVVGFTEVAKPIMDSNGITPTWDNTSQEVSFHATCITAARNLLAAVKEDDLHNGSDRMLTVLIKSVIEKSVELANQVNEQFPQSKDSFCSLAQSYVKNGACLMERNWIDHAVTARAYINQASDHEQEYFKAKGYPFKSVLTNFDCQMDMLAGISERAIATIVDTASNKLEFQPH